MSVTKIVRCFDCKNVLFKEDGPCKKCGSKKKEVLLTITETIEVCDQIKGKTKEKGIKKPRIEFKIGNDFSFSRNKFVDKTWVLDRKNNKYLERVVDK